MWLSKKKKIGLIALFLFGIILLVVILTHAFVNGQPKTPVTCQQVTEVLSDLGYSPSDTTSMYEKQDSNLVNSIAVETEKIRFDFFEFNNDDSASNVFSHAYNQILDYRNGYTPEYGQDIETDEYYANYRLYSLKSGGMYYLTIRVGSTAIYTYCDEDYINELGKILSGIGYTGDSKKAE